VDKSKQIFKREDLAGKTIKKVCDLSFYQLIFVFTDGTYVIIEGDGEEIQGSHWPIISTE